MSSCPTCGRTTYVPDAVVVAIREQYAAGTSQVDLAAKHGVSQAFVSKAVHGRVRPGVGGPVAPTRTYNRSKRGVQ